MEDGRRMNHCQAAKEAHNRGDYESREHHFDQALEQLKRMADTHQVDQALVHEDAIYNHIVKLTETEEETFAKMQRIIPIMHGLGEFVRSKLPPLEETESDDRFKLGFIFANGAFLAHSKLFHSICQGMLSLTEDQSIRPVIYNIGHLYPDFERKFNELNIPIRTASTKGPTNSVVVNLLLNLRRLIAEDGVKITTWMSTPCGAGFFMGARYSKTQCYWSMKFHTMIRPSVDHYIAMGSIWEETRQINGVEWTCGPAVFANALEGGKPEQIPEIRAKYGAAE